VIFLVGRSRPVKRGGRYRQAAQVDTLSPRATAATRKLRSCERGREAVGLTRAATGRLREIVGSREAPASALPWPTPVSRCDGRSWRDAGLQGGIPPFLWTRIGSRRRPQGPP